MSRAILVIADDPSLALHYERTLRDCGYEVRCKGSAHCGIEAALAEDSSLVVVTQAASDLGAADLVQQIRAGNESATVIVLSSNASLESAIAAMRAGAADYLVAPCSTEELRRALDRAERARPRSRPPGRPPESTEAYVFEGMLGKCAAMREVFELIQRIAPADSTVLVTGESGTGKEMVARAIHRHSRRRDLPFLACDCTALAPTLLESELFGHVKGSFSGAIATKKGLFEAAHQGTLMLDEVSNLSVETQAKLLRLLETRRVRKVGDTAEHEVDIRLIATTNRNLAEMVKNGSFRADLYYRLNVVPVLLPPLRDRHDDIPLLATVFLERFSRRMNVGATSFANDALEQLRVYSWPGNVRELRNIVERLAVLYGGSTIGLEHLPIEIREAKSQVSSESLPATWEEFKRYKRQIIEELERRFLLAALDRCSQSVTQAAESVGMQRTNFHALLRSHGLRPTRPRNP